MIFDQTGSLANVSRHDYLPFGEEVPSNFRTGIPGYATLDNVRQKFTGYEKDSETGLNFAQARYQSATQGRFISVDPFQGSATVADPQSFNRYAYVGNNPINFIDPTGMSAQSGGPVLPGANGALARASVGVGLDPASGSDPTTDVYPRTISVIGQSQAYLAFAVAAHETLHAVAEVAQNPIAKPAPAPTPDKGDPTNPCSNHHLNETNREMESIARKVGGRYDPKLGTITRLGNLTMAEAVNRFQSAGFELFFSFNWNVHPGANLQWQWMNGQYGDTHYYHVTVEPSRYMTTTVEVRSAARAYAAEMKTVTVPDPSAAPRRITIHCDSGHNYSLRHIWYDYFQMRWP